MKKAAIFGAGGHAMVVKDIISDLGFKNILFYEDYSKNLKKDSSLVKISGDLSDLINDSYKYNFITVAIGDNKIRSKKISKFVEGKIILKPLISSKAIISKSSKVGNFSMIMNSVNINSNTKVGEGCIINTGSIIEHDCLLMNNVHISPGAVICGNVKIGNDVWVGANSVIKENITIGHGSIIGAGSIVVRDVKSKTKVMGLVK